MYAYDIYSCNVCGMGSRVRETSGVLRLQNALVLTLPPQLAFVATRSQLVGAQDGGGLHSSSPLV